MENNLFIQRKIQNNENDVTASIIFAYYFYVKEELYVSKYALCIKLDKELLYKHC